MVKLFLKNSNLCDHNPPTSQTDRRTDRQTTCDRNTALCTKVHRAVKTNNAKYCKTNLPWFSRLLRHSAIKQDGHILQYFWAHTGQNMELRTKLQNFYEMCIQHGDGITLNMVEVVSDVHDESSYWTTALTHAASRLCINTLSSHLILHHQATQARC